MKNKLKRKIALFLLFISSTGVNIFAQTIGNQPISYSAITQNPTCSSFNDGEILVTIQGGNPPYWFNGLELPGNEALMTGLSSGSYDFYISDSNQSNLIGNASIQDPESPLISSVVGNASDLNSSDGFIDLTVSYYTNVAFNWGTLESVQLNVSTEDQFNLSAGDYWVVITDNLGCEYVERFTIQTPTEILTPILTDFATSDPVYDVPDMVDVFPNPSSGNFRVRAQEDIKSFIIFTESGNLIKKGSGHELKNDLFLEKGNYMLTMELENGNSIKKAVKVL
jgi:hypothetical protein